MIVVGHNLVTSFGVWMLTHKAEADSGLLPSLADSRAYTADNATAIVLDLDKNHEEWLVTGRITPKIQDISIAVSLTS